MNRACVICIKTYSLLQGHCLDESPFIFRKGTEIASACRCRSGTQVNATLAHKYSVSNRCALTVSNHCLLRTLNCIGFMRGGKRISIYFSVSRPLGSCDEPALPEKLVDVKFCFVSSVKAEAGKIH